jgi:phosphopantothenate---cysteine ligase (CTP)
MHCVVTAGPTYEPLDEVRRLTNLSTGRLGTVLANHLTGCGHRVTLLLGQQATWSGPCQAAAVIRFSTTADLAARLAALAQTQVQAVLHAAAVSDFRFGRVWQRGDSGELTELSAGKISSRLEGLSVELLPTVKIINQLRAWFPGAWLVGWKYEVDGDRTLALRHARDQLEQARADACVANGPAYGEGYGLVTADGCCRHQETLDALCAALGAWLASPRPP